MVSVDSFYPPFIKVASYSIKDLEKLTGVKAHTIRIWEQRYHLIAPQRTDTNIRYYSDHEARKLLKISTLYHHGIKISKLASMSDNDLNESILDIEVQAGSQGVAIERLTLAMIDLSEEHFVSVFNQCIEEFGFKDTMMQIIYPFLQKIGILWQVGDIHPAQEHFISNLIRQKLIARIDRIYKPKSDAHQKIILFLPEEELHELGLLFYSYLLQELDYHVIYLGQAVPAQDLVKVAEKYKCHLFLSSLIHSSAVEHFTKTVELLNQRIGKQLKIYLAGSQHGSLPPLASVHKLSNIQEFTRIFGQSV